MARSRSPNKKVEVSGAAIKNPGRYRDRSKPKLPAIGAPYARMTQEQIETWQEFAQNLPWLNRGHRQLLRLACILTARIDTEGDIGISAIHALSSILSKLGATPVDESKISHGEDDSEDPAEEFFSTRH